MRQNWNCNERVEVSMVREKSCLVLFAFLVLVLFALNLFFGSVDMPAMQVVDALLGREPEVSSSYFIVMESRLPQALTALLCGAALAACGLMLQTVFRNPLAGPSILGIVFYLHQGALQAF